MTNKRAETSPTGRPVALVTGASRGIGKQTALQLAEAGWDVAVTGRTMVEGTGRVAPRTASEAGSDLPVPGSLEGTVAEIRERGAAGLAVPMDLTDLASVRRAAAAVLEECGRCACW